MGRLAGPQSGGQISRAWKRRIKERRELLDNLAAVPSKPLVSPPSMRALLCYVARELPFGLGIGRKHRPPCTPDMRWLAEHGYLQRQRERIGLGHRWSELILSLSGHRKASAYDLPETDWSWITGTFHNGMLR